MCPVHPLVCRVLAAVTPRAVKSLSEVMFPWHALSCFISRRSTGLSQVCRHAPGCSQSALQPQLSACSVLTASQLLQDSQKVQVCSIILLAYMLWCARPDGSKLSVMLSSASLFSEMKPVFGMVGQRELISTFVMALPTQRSLPLCVHVSFGTPETLRAYMQNSRQTPCSNLYATESCILHTRKP